MAPRTVRLVPASPTAGRLLSQTLPQPTAVVFFPHKNSRDVAGCEAFTNAHGAAVRPAPGAVAAQTRLERLLHGGEDHSLRHRRLVAAHARDDTDLEVVLVDDLARIIRCDDVVDDAMRAQEFP